MNLIIHLFLFCQIIHSLAANNQNIKIHSNGRRRRQDKDSDDDSYELDSESGNEDSLSVLSDFIDKTSFTKSSETNPLPTFISEEFSDMSIDTSAFSLDFKCPFMQYGCIEENQSYCEVDMLVLTLPSKYF